MSFFINKIVSSNVYSQHGEDGVINDICNKLDIQIKTCMEFGAWDGKHFSNTFNLVEKGAKAIMVEGDQQKYKDLLKTCEEYPNIRPILRYVLPTGPDSVENILNENGIEEVDLLSIDVDSSDFQIFDSLKKKHKIIVVEFNPTFGITEEYSSEEGKCIGSSFYSFVVSADKKNYSLVSYTNTNLFFVRTELITNKNFVPLNLECLEILHNINKCGLRVASGYDGSRLAFGKDKNPWDGSRIAKVLYIPNFLKKWPPNYFHIIGRALLTLKPNEIIAGIKKTRRKGWFNHPFSFLLNLFKDV